MSAQLNEIMHAGEFQKLEGSWRGLNDLVMNSETGTMLKMRVLNVSRKEQKRRFLERVERSHASLKAGRGVRLEEV